MPDDSLHHYLSQQGAQFGGVAGEQVAQNYGDTNAEHLALIESVALVDLSFRGCLAVLGDDRVKFINGQVTNEVAGYSRARAATPRSSMPRPRCRPTCTCTGLTTS